MIKKFIMLICILFLFNCGGAAGAAASVIASIIPDGCQCDTVEQADYGEVGLKFQDKVELTMMIWDLMVKR